MFATLLLAQSFFCLPIHPQTVNHIGWQESLEWEVAYWQWESDSDEAEDIPKNARPIASVTIYKEIGAKALTSTTFGDTCLRVAVVPTAIDQEGGVITKIRASVLHLQPSGSLVAVNGASGTTFSNDLRLGQRKFIAGNSLAGKKKKRALSAFTLTVRKPTNKDFEEMSSDSFPAKVTIPEGHKVFPGSAKPKNGREANTNRTKDNTGK